MYINSNSTANYSKGTLIVLLSTPLGKRNFNQENMATDDLGLGYLYISLKNKGYNVHLINTICKDYTLDELMRMIIKLKPTYIGFSETIIGFEQSLLLSKKLKKSLHNLKIIYGDIHPSLFSFDILKNEPHIDFVICGEGDRSLPMLIEALENNGNIERIPGLTYRYNGKINMNPPDVEVDLNSLPIPFHSSLEDSKPNSIKVFALSASRGCPGRCTFCSMALFSNQCQIYGLKRWRPRSPENIFNELKYLYRYGARKFMFIDDNWIGERDIGLKNALRLCNMITREGLDITFNAIIRPDSLLPTDQKALEVMKQAGLCKLSIGLEASNDEQLRLYGKKYDLSMVKDVVALIHDMQIFINLGYIMFFPYSTFDMLKKNINFLSENRLAHCPRIYFSQLVGWSKIFLEKKLEKDNLIQRPTTYKQAGIYKFKNKRIKSLFDCVCNIFRPELNTFQLLQTLGYEATRLSKNEPDTFIRIMKSAERIGKSSADLFRFCINQYDSDLIESEISSNIQTYKRNWDNTLSKEKLNL